jgi:hypothetical protein
MGGEPKEISFPSPVPPPVTRMRFPEEVSVEHERVNPAIRTAAFTAKPSRQIDTLLYFICKSLSSQLNEVLSAESGWKPAN